MIEKLLKIVRTQFVRNVVTIATGTAAAHVISVLFSPLITRLYGPEAFGILGVFLSIIAIVSTVSSLAYDIAIVLPEKDRDALGLLKLSLYILFAVSILLCIVSLGFKEQVVEILNIQKISSFVWLLPIAVLLASSTQIIRNWMTRKNGFSIIAKVGVIQTVVINGIKSGIGFFWPTALALIFFSIAGDGMFFLMLTRSARKTWPFGNFWNALLSRPDIKHLRTLASQYRDFPFFRAPQALLSGVTAQIPVLLLASLFGPASAGFYAIGLRVLRIPSQIIGKSVGDVFYPKLALEGNMGNNLKPLITKATFGLAAIGIVPFGIIMAFGPEIFEFVFGSDWVNAGEYSRWISLLSLFAFITHPSVKAVSVLRIQKFFLAYEVVSSALRVLSIFVAYYIFRNDLITIAVFCTTGSILSLIRIVWIVVKSGKL